MGFGKVLGTVGSVAGTVICGTVVLAGKLIYESANILLKEGNAAKNMSDDQLFHNVNNSNSIKAAAARAELKNRENSD